jgi:hypothetical protein
MCYFLHTFFWNIYHSKKNLARYQSNVYAGLHVEYPFFVSHCNETLIFWTEFRKLLKYQISWNDTGAKFFMWTDGRTDTIKTYHTYYKTDLMKLTVNFRNFVNAPRNRSWSRGKVGMYCIHVTQKRNQYWATLTEVIKIAAIKLW